MWPSFWWTGPTPWCDYEVSSDQYLWMCMYTVWLPSTRIVIFAGNTSTIWKRLHLIHHFWKSIKFSTVQKGAVYRHYLAMNVVIKAHTLRVSNQSVFCGTAIYCWYYLHIILSAPIQWWRKRGKTSYMPICCLHRLDFLSGMSLPSALAYLVQSS